MRTNMKKYFLFILLCFISLSGAALGFDIPENLKYELTLGGIKIGNVSLEARHNASYIELDSRVTSVRWVSMFYEVEDNAVSFVTKKPQKKPAKTFAYDSRTYRVKLNEGPYRINKEFYFDQAKKIVTYKDYITNEKTYHLLKASAMDPLLSLYYIRQIPLKTGESVFVSTFNNKLIYKVAVQVLRKETLKTSLGTINTILIRSNMNSVGDGILYSPGDIYIWLTDDDKKIPVLIEKRLDTLVEGKLPDFLKGKIPGFLKDKLTGGSVKAALLKD